MMKLTRMFNKQLIATLLFLFFTQAFAAVNTEKKAVENAYYAWCQSISTAKGDAKVVVKFYAPDAILLPTLSPKILHNTHGGMNEYFAHLTSYRDVRCVPQKLITHMEGNIALNSGLYTFTYLDNHGKQKTIPARFTFVYKKINDQWLITQHHSSKLP